MQEAIDQAAHFLIAYGVVTLLGFLGATFTPASGLLLGFAIAATREVTEGGNILSDGSITDTCFWMLGAFFGVVL